MNDAKIDIYNHPCWIVSGNQDNFELSVQYKQIWGVMNKWYPQWKALEKGDNLFFYISGVKKIVGIGQSGNKFIQREPFWPDEIEEGKVKYPLKFEFSFHHLLPKKEWKDKGISVTGYIQKNLGTGAFADLLRGGVNFIRNENLVVFLYKNFKEKFDYEIKSSEDIIASKTKIESLPKIEGLHNHLIELIVEIGRMNGLLSEKEYSYSNMRFDAVWRRVDRGSPTYVFEVQVEGDVYHALAKLKHAFDLWNSNIFLIISNNKDFYSAQELLNGTFHEIKEKIKIVATKEMQELHRRKFSWIELEQKLGIL
jgi:predicted RNA-binding protein